MSAKLSSFTLIRSFLKAVSKKRFIFYIPFIFLGAVLGYILFYTSNELEVELRDNGFYPKLLEINKGDIVIFKNKRGRPFWPASDLHPRHLAYKEFDSKRPVKPGGEWRFIFNKPGKWNYHDHLARTLRVLWW